MGDDTRLREALARHRSGDPEGIHQLRTRARRLRATRPELTDDLRWLGRELSAARDAVVVHERLSGLLDDEEDADAARALLDRHMVDEAEAGQRAAERALHDPRFEALLTALADDSPAAKGRREERADVAGAAAKATKRIARAEGGDDEALHSLRKAAKGLRYAAEAEGEEKVAKRAKRVQTRLGELQDSVVSRELIDRLARTGRPTARAAFVLGRVHAREEATAVRHRARAEKAWRRLADFLAQIMST